METATNVLPFRMMTPLSTGFLDTSYFHHLTTCTPKNTASNCSIIHVL